MMRVMEMRAIATSRNQLTIQLSPGSSGLLGIVSGKIYAGEMSLRSTQDIGGKEKSLLRIWVEKIYKRVASRVGVHSSDASITKIDIRACSNLRHCIRIESYCLGVRTRVELSFVANGPDGFFLDLFGSTTWMKTVRLLNETFQGKTTKHPTRVLVVTKYFPQLQVSILHVGEGGHPQMKADH